MNFERGESAVRVLPDVALSANCVCFCVQLEVSKRSLVATTLFQRVLVEPSAGAVLTPSNEVRLAVVGMETNQPLFEVLRIRLFPTTSGFVEGVLAVEEGRVSETPTVGRKRAFQNRRQFLADVLDGAPGGTHDKGNDAHDRESSHPAS